MFNVGGPEIVVIFLVALIVLGPQQLPKAMRTVGSVMAEIRKVSSSFQAEMRSAMDAVVDTSGSEKPKSASMADATPASTEPTDSDAPEVVVRNDAPPADRDEPAASPVADEQPRPAVDPADRAAG